MVQTYGLVCWLNAETAESLATDFRKLAMDLVRERETLPFPRTAAAILPETDAFCVVVLQEIEVGDKKNDEIVDEIRSCCLCGEDTAFAFRCLCGQDTAFALCFRCFLWPRHCLCVVFPLRFVAKTPAFALCFRCLCGQDTAFVLCFRCLCG